MKETIRYSVLSGTCTKKHKRCMRRRNVWRELEDRFDRADRSIRPLSTVKNFHLLLPGFLKVSGYLGTSVPRRESSIPGNRVPRAQIANWLARARVHDGRREGRERERTASLAYYSKVSSDFPRQPLDSASGGVIAIKHRKLAKLRCNLAGDVLPPHLHFETPRRVHVHTPDSRLYSADCSRRVCTWIHVFFPLLSSSKRFASSSSLRGAFTRACVCLAKYEHACVCLCLRVYTDDVVKSWEISWQRLDPRFGN